MASGVYAGHRECHGRASWPALVARAKRLQDLGPARPAAKARVDPDTQRASDAARCVAGVEETALKLSIRLYEVVAQPLAEGCKPHSSARAFEQAPAHLDFESANDLADAGGIDPEPVGGPAEVEFVGDGEKRPQLA